MEGGQLDDVAVLAAADPGETLRAVATSAAQVRSAATAAAEAGVPRLATQSRPRAVVIVGMGNSAIAGQVLGALAGPGCPVPVLPAAGFSLPAWVGAADLVIALSRSGTTAETLAVTEEAVRRGAEVVGIGAADTPLHDLTERARGVFVPTGAGSTSAGPSSWASFFSLATPLLAVGAALGLLEASAEVFEATAQRLSGLALRCQPSSESFLNPAKDLALAVAGALPIALGTSPLSAVAADRLASSWSRNAGAPAIAGQLPGAAHSLLSTLDGSWAGAPENPFADPVEASGPARLHLILLRDPEAHPRIAQQADAARDLAQRRGVKLVELQAEGSSRYERLAALIGLLDFASVYLALLTGMDPSRPTAGHALAAHPSGAGPR